MFYETAQTVGPGWHRSYKPSHYEDMSWTPSSKKFRSPGSSPETYRRIVRENDDDFRSPNHPDEDDFFSSGRTLPRRIFKEAFNENPSSNRFSDRPRMFKRVFKPSHWEDEVPNLRREFDRDFDDPRSPTSKLDQELFNRKFDDSKTTTKKFDDFNRRFNDIDDDFERSEGRVHHIPIMVERKIEEMKSRFGRDSSPPDKQSGEDYAEDWNGPEVQRLRKHFEVDDEFSPRRHRGPRADINFKSRANPTPETWDPHAIHTLPTRRAHKASQSFDDCRHPVPPKYVFRSYSETHEDIPKPHQPHSTAFRSHSDGHCPNQDYVTKIEVNMPRKESDELDGRCSQCQDQKSNISKRPDNQTANNQNSSDSEKWQCDESSQDTNIQSPGTHQQRPKLRGSKYDSPSLQQIAAVLQNVEDLVIRVDNYSGTGRDKHYRFLDEMLTRCMLRLDDVDTEGREDTRNARKAALREVQSCIDKLEAKADESERRQKERSSGAPASFSAAEHSRESIPPTSGEESSPIPLPEGPSAVPPTEGSSVIPLPAASNAIPLPAAESAIPLGDAPQAIPLSGAIPLGYTPGTIEKQRPEDKDESVEQTKL